MKDGAYSLFSKVVSSVAGNDFIDFEQEGNDLQVS